jgi:hypothetical protein
METKVTIDRFEGDKAVLITGDKKAINWPQKYLPQNAKEGSVLTVMINDGKNQNDADKRLAKNILNEILNPEA